MIIECPACATRYDIKASFPPEGRTVRCAKCGTVWRAMPQAIGEQSGGGPAAEEEKQAPDSNGTSEPPQEAAVSPSAKRASFHSHYAGEDRASEDAAFSARHLAAPEMEQAVQAGEMDKSAQPEFGSHMEAPAPQEPESGKVSWLFRRRNKSEGAEAADNGGVRSAPGETIPFMRPSLSEERASPQATNETLETLEEARAAVRSVFSSLADTRSAPQGRAFAAAGTEAFGDAQGGEHLAEAGERHRYSPPEAEAPIYGTSEDTSANGGVWASSQGYVSQEYHGSAEPAYHTVHTPEDEYNRDKSDTARDQSGDWSSFGGDNEPDARQDWRDDDASAATEQNYTEEFEKQSSGDAAAHARDILDRIGHQNFFAEKSGAARHGEGKLAQELETRLRVNPPPRPPSIEQSPQDDDYTPVDDGAYDDRLYREIEKTREHTSDPSQSRRRGGLALAAAWGLFLCAASGIGIGFIAFRDIVADALPGIAPVYRALGMPVTVQPLIFESVQYKWAVSENKPAVVITGSIYNRSQRKVKVPEFFITIKDQNPELDREYSANIQASGSKIKGGRRSDFEIELLSPNPTITAIELELRNVH
jgi:predicted Zn finger-like uncharacterized protein